MCKNVGYSVLIFDMLVFQWMLSSKLSTQWGLLTGSLIPPVANRKWSDLRRRIRQPVLRGTLLAIAANTRTIPITATL